MKKGEQLLDALTDVKSSYILECSQYVGNEQKDVLLLKPRKTHWAHFAAVAACLALLLTVTLIFLPNASREQKEEVESDDAIFSTTIRLIDGIQVKIIAERGETSDAYCPIQQIEVYRDGTLLQSIQSIFLQYMYLRTEGEVGRPDFRDLNFDGYTDIGFPMPAGSKEGENLDYLFWLWDPDTEQYDTSENHYLKGGAYLEVDEEDQTLIETVLLSVGVLKNFYQYENSQLVHVRDEVTPASQPSYQITYDEAEFGLTTGDSGDCISPLKGVDSYQPVCEIQIEYLSGILPSVAVSQTEASLEAEGAEVAAKSKDWGRTTLHVEYGDQWDSKVEDIYFVAAGIRGCFRLTAQYYLEAENYQTIFSEICSSFICPLSESENAEAERTVAAYADAFFSQDWSTLSQYASEEVNFDNAYDGFRWHWSTMSEYASDDFDWTAVEVVGLDGLGTVEEQIAENGSADLDLMFQADDAHYTHLVMRMTKVDGEYKIYISNIWYTDFIQH